MIDTPPLLLISWVEDQFIITFCMDQKGDNTDDHVDVVVVSVD